MPAKNKTKFFKHAAIYIIAFILLFSIFKAIEWARAGNLNPDAAPAAGMNTLEEIYGVTDGAYDASGVSADANGSIMEQLKAIKDGLGM